MAKNDFGGCFLRNLEIMEDELHSLLQGGGRKKHPRSRPGRPQSPPDGQPFRLPRVPHGQDVPCRAHAPAEREN